MYVLGGNIVPFGSSGMMTTSYLRASNLTLLAAFPSAHSPSFERCGQGCAAHSTPNRLVTCGHMYLDHGGFTACVHLAWFAGLSYGDMHPLPLVSALKPAVLQFESTGTSVQG